MNYLRYRSISKPIRRNNAEKAINRIEAEINVLINNSPRREEMPITVESAKNAVRNAMFTVQRLYQRKV